MSIDSNDVDKRPLTDEATSRPEAHDRSRRRVLSGGAALTALAAVPYVRSVRAQGRVVV